MKPTIFAYPRRIGIRGISIIGRRIMTIKFISDDPDWLRTRFSGKNDEFIDAIGISYIPGDLRNKCYNSGGFWESKYDSFEWRSRTIFRDWGMKQISEIYNR